MSDPENFLARWSRRKREAGDEARKDAAVVDARGADTQDGTDDGAPGGQRAQAEATRPQSHEPPFDLASLPSLDSITADTDIRSFFAPGVPPELTRAALRRVWSADPKIRDFVGLAENDWDFNNPGAVAGFGPLEMTPELRREVARIVGNLLPEEDSAVADAVPPPQRAPESVPSPQMAEAPQQIPAGTVADYQPTEIAAVETVSGQVEPALPTVESDPHTATTHRKKDYAAPQQRSSREQGMHSSGKRGHGGALPK